MQEDIDSLIFDAVFSPDESVKTQTRKEIRELALKNGIFISSIASFYHELGNSKVSGFTVPAINIRALTYDTARVIFRLMNTHNIGALVFEIARSEIEYTDQRP